MQSDWRGLLATAQLNADQDFALLRAAQQAPTTNLGHAALATKADILGIELADTDTGR